MIKRKKHPWLRLFAAVFILILGLAAFIGVYAKKAADGIYSKLNKDESSDFSRVSDSRELRSDDGVINILLLGCDKNEDEQDAVGAARRTDSMMILSLNKSNHRVSVISLMRDMYLDVPGHDREKLNAAYEQGGPALLYSAIAENYRIRLDGYASVDFDCFKEIINAVGGINVKLTESEAENLNTTNYIKRKKNRNLKPGKQHLNGDQALGYCRIRHGTYVNGHYPGVFTADGKGDDFARTQRQRTVIRKIVKKLKNKAPGKLIKIMNRAAPFITTDLSEKDCIKFGLQLVLMKNCEFKSHSLPVHYKSEYAGRQQVLVTDVEKDRKALYRWVFGGR